MKYSHACFGSRLEITIDSSENYTDIVKACFHTADEFEQKYSRFINGNILYSLNNTKTAKVDSEFLSIINLCQRVSKLSDGHFDITLLPVLENLGYGIHTETLHESVWYENIIISENTITLNNNVSIDIGAVGKWYMVDKIYNMLSEKFESFMINFGWDIRLQWYKTIQLEDPNDALKSIGYIDIENISIASSAGNKRKFWNSHHLLNAKTKQSQNDKLAVYVTHKLSSFSDIFSTALFVTPLERAIKILEQIPGLEALIIASDGKMYKSKWFNCIFNTTKKWV